jgi:hypothetical protein
MSGGWLKLEVTPEVEFEIRSAEVKVAEAMKRDPKAVAELATALVRQNIMLTRINDAAMRRVAELETREALGPGSADRWMGMARQMAKQFGPPWWKRLWWLVTLQG